MTNATLNYVPIPWMSKSEINAAIRDNLVEKLEIAVLSAALNSGDGIWAEKVCFKLVNHSDPTVRGNALLSLGHIARIHGKLDRKRAIKTLEAALNDEDEFVRGHAEDALEDVQHFVNKQAVDRLGRKRLAR